MKWWLIFLIVLALAILIFWLIGVKPDSYQVKIL